MKLQGVSFSQPKTVLPLHMKMGQFPLRAQNGDSISFGQRLRGRPSLFRKITVGLGAFLPLISLFPGAASAAISPESQKVVDFVQKTWNKHGDFKEFTAQDWNNILVGLEVSDNTMELDLQPIREAILEEGALSAYIPADIVQHAIYTAGELGAALPRTSEYDPLRNRLSNLVEPWTRSVVEDQETYEKKTRTFRSANALDRHKENVHDFTEVATNALIKIAAPRDLANLTQAMDLAGEQAENIVPYFNIISELAPHVPLPQTASGSIESRAVGWIYDSSSMSATSSQTTTPPNNQPDGVKPAPLPVPPVSIAADVQEQGDSSSSLPLFLQPLTVNSSGDKKSLDTCGTEKELLAALPASQKKPILVCLENSANTELAADAIYFLAKRNYDAVNLIPAMAQWFTRTEIDDAVTRSFDESDLKVIESLALRANTDKEAFELLLKLMASYPEQMQDLMVTASTSMKAEHVQVRETGKQILEVFKGEHLEQVREFVRELANRKADLLWPQDHAISDYGDAYEQIRQDGRNLGIFFMLTDAEHRFVEDFRQILSNPEIGYQSQAIAGVALAKDTESIPRLMDIGTRKVGNSLGIRTLALQAVLYIMTPDTMPLEIQAGILQEKPIGFSQLAAYSMDVNDSVEGEEQQNDVANPFQRLIDTQFAQWEAELARLQQSAARDGRIIPISDADRASTLYKLTQRQFSSGSESTSVLAQAQGDARNTQLRAIRDYLSDGLREEANGVAGVNMALAMLQILGKAQDTHATALLVDMAQHPADYVPQNFPMIQQKVFAPFLVKHAALEALGYTAEPGSDAAQFLQQGLNSPLLSVQFSTLKALSVMGQRGPDSALKARHGEQVLTQLDRLEERRTSFTQDRRKLEMLRKEYLKTAAVLGGITPLLERAQAALEGDSQPETVRSIAHVLIGQGVTAEEVNQLGFDGDSLITYFQEKQYWLPPSLERGDYEVAQESDRHTHLHFDTGHVMPVGELEGRVSYPSWTRLSNEKNWSNSHPTATAETLRQNDPQVQIRSYHVGEEIPVNPFKVDVLQDSLFVALADAIENKMTGVSAATTSNHSYGMANAYLYHEAFREQVFDLFGAFFEVLGESGVTNVVAAGNSQIDGPLAEFESLGSLNNLGSRFDENGRVEKPDTTVVSSAIDYVTGWLAEFSSLPNPLTLEDAYEFFGTPGYQDLTVWFNETTNQWEKSAVDGTSFSAPNLTGLIRMAENYRVRHGLTPWTPQEVVSALRLASGPLPGLEDEVWATGNVIDALRFLELSKEPNLPQPVANPSQSTP